MAGCRTIFWSLMQGLHNEESFRECARVFGGPLQRSEVPSWKGCIARVRAPVWAMTNGME